MNSLNNPEYKLQYNKEHFDIAASKYDIATRILSLGQDSKWKSNAVTMLSATKINRALDLACGTGDMIELILRRYTNAEVLGVDISEAMLKVARTKFSEKVAFANHSISSLTFQNEFDLITASYALRNAPNFKDTICQVSRALKIGGEFLLIDFVKPRNKLYSSIQSLIMSIWGGFCGLALHFNPNIHSYLGASLKNYITQEVIIEECRKCHLMLTKRRSSLLGVEILIFSKNN